MIQIIFVLLLVFLLLFGNYYLAFFLLLGYYIGAIKSILFPRPPLLNSSQNYLSSDPMDVIESEFNKLSNKQKFSIIRKIKTSIQDDVRYILKSILYTISHHPFIKKIEIVALYEQFISTSGIILNQLHDNESVETGDFNDRLDLILPQDIQLKELEKYITKLSIYAETIESNDPYQRMEQLNYYWNALVTIRVLTHEEQEEEKRAWMQRQPEE